MTYASAAIVSSACSGLFAANFLSVLFAVLLPVDTLSGEIDSGVIQTVASKPIRRADIVIGKWLGHAVIVISHNLAEVFQVADRIAVLYLGRLAAAGPASEFNTQSVVEYMTTGTSSRSNGSRDNGDAGGSAAARF